MISYLNTICIVILWISATYASCSDINGTNAHEVIFNKTLPCGTVVGIKRPLRIAEWQAFAAKWKNNVASYDRDYDDNGSNYVKNVSVYLTSKQGKQIIIRDGPVFDGNRYCDGFDIYDAVYDDSSDSCVILVRYQVIVRIYRLNMVSESVAFQPRNAYSEITEYDHGTRKISVSGSILDSRTNGCLVSIKRKTGSIEKYRFNGSDWIEVFDNKK